MKFLVTNDGVHPADKWADFTVDEILDLIKIAPELDSVSAHNARAAKRDLGPILFRILDGHYGDVQTHERGHLTENIKDEAAAAEHADAKIDPTPHLSVMDQIFAAFDASPFKEHFAKPEVREVLTQIAGQHTANVMNIERKTHLDRHVAAAKKEA
jgi:hypothetical protein